MAQIITRVSNRAFVGAPLCTYADIRAFAKMNDLSVQAVTVNMYHCVGHLL
jgi:hypothetical protein